MTGNKSAHLFSPSQSYRAWVACAMLTVVSLLALLVCACIGYSRSGFSGIFASAVAAGVCWVGAMIALLLSSAFRGDQQAVYGTVLGTLFRTGIPLVSGLILHRSGGALAESGVLGMILGVYFVTLVAETWLALRVIAPTTEQQNATKAC